MHGHRNLKRTLSWSPFSTKSSLIHPGLTLYNSGDVPKSLPYEFFNAEIQDAKSVYQHSPVKLTGQTFHTALVIPFDKDCRGQLKCDGTRAETRFHLSAEWTSLHLLLQSCAKMFCPKQSEHCSVFTFFSLAVQYK
jgi:hypothetical protein